VTRGYVDAATGQFVEWPDLEPASAPPPDSPDNPTNEREAASISGKEVLRPVSPEPGQPPTLAREPDILDHFRVDLRRAGVAGEERLASVLYLALTSRVLPWGKPTERPISVIPKGTTSTGKSHVTQMVLRFFPASAYVSLGSMSKRYLFYSEEKFAHRFIIVPEWASIAEDDELVALLRTLLSEGRVIHGTVDEKRKASKIEKEGPTGLIVTTTDAVVDAEMETRCLSLLTDDTPEQTRRIYDAFADLEEENGSAVDFDAWHDLQSWIAEHGETRVVIPFVRALGELMPASATRLRRDFVSLLCLVRAHAILYQAQRDHDQYGRIIATVEGDYAPVRGLVAELIAEGVEAGASQAIRQTVAAVRELQDEGASQVNPKALIKKLGVGRSATYDRIRRALLNGHLINEAAKHERGMKLVVGELLPGEEEFLPSPEAFVRQVEKRSGRTPFGSTLGGSEGLSGCPGRPTDPAERDLAEALCLICELRPVEGGPCSLRCAECRAKAAA
jgi:hypothetical protein